MAVVVVGLAHRQTLLTDGALIIEVPDLLHFLFAGQFQFFLNVGVLLEQLAGQFLVFFFLNLFDGLLVADALKKVVVLVHVVGEVVVCEGLHALHWRGALLYLQCELPLHLGFVDISLISRIQLVV